jgi:hypothetical protein
MTRKINSDSAPYSAAVSGPLSDLLAELRARNRQDKKPQSEQIKAQQPKTRRNDKPTATRRHEHPGASYQNKTLKLYSSHVPPEDASMRRMPLVTHRPLSGQSGQSPTPKKHQGRHAMVRFLNSLKPNKTVRPHRPVGRRQSPRNFQPPQQVFTSGGAAFSHLMFRNGIDPKSVVATSTTLEGGDSSEQAHIDYEGHVVEPQVESTLAIDSLPWLAELGNLQGLKGLDSELFLC